ncbi:MAG: homoserine kinase, partial [Lutibacter sp.]|nr:homoserine kinase [Lutibacter sp.]
WGINHLLGSPYKTEALVPFAMEGERLASGAAHADNVAPALFGGITLVRSYDPLDVIGIPVPEQLFATIIHPQIEIKTADARELLKTKIPMRDAIRQWGNVGGLISGLYTEDYALISRSLQDHIVEPIRSLLIPAFDQLKKASLAAGALGAGISGSGPSVFALSKGKDTAHKVSAAMETVYKGLGIAYETHVSTINQEGIQLLT